MKILFKRTLPVGPSSQTLFLTKTFELTQLVQMTDLSSPSKDVSKSKSEDSNRHEAVMKPNKLARYKQHGGPTGSCNKHCHVNKYV